MGGEELTSMLSIPSDEDPDEHVSPSSSSPSCSFSSLLDAAPAALFSPACGLALVVGGTATETMLLAFLDGMVIALISYGRQDMGGRIEYVS